MELQLAAPVTVLYRGDLWDTASLVGLAHSRAPVGMIAFTGELSEELKKYCEIFNPWLKSKGLPAVSIHPTLTAANFERLVDRPHKTWGWGEKECKAALQLAGLPLPPTFTAP